MVIRIGRRIHIQRRSIPYAGALAISPVRQSVFAKPIFAVPATVRHHKQVQTARLFSGRFLNSRRFGFESSKDPKSFQRGSVATADCAELVRAVRTFGASVSRLPNEPFKLAVRPCNLAVVATIICQ